MHFYLNKYKASSKLIWSTRYFNSGNVKKAIELTKESLNIFPDNPKAFILLGNIYKSMNEYSKALKYYQLNINLNKSKIISYTLAIDCLFKLNENKEALKLIEEGLDNHENNFELLLCKIYAFEKMKEYDMEIKCADQIISTGENIVEALFIKATVYELQENYKCSFKCYEKITTINEKSIDAWYGLVLSSYYLKNIEDAIKFVEIVINLDNENPYTYCLYSSFLEKSGDYTKALENINIAIKLDNNHSYYYLKGLILDELNEKVQAKKFYKIGVEIALDRLNDNKSSNSYALIGAFFEKLEDHDKADKYFNKAGEMTSKDLDDIYLNN